MNSTDYTNGFADTSYLPVNYIPNMSGLEPSIMGEQYPLTFHQQNPGYLATTMTVAQYDVLQNSHPPASAQARMGTPQRMYLESQFIKNPKPSTEEKARFATIFQLPIAKINNWFQNRRAQAKRQDKEAAAAELHSIQERTPDDSPALTEDNAHTESTRTSVSPAQSYDSVHPTPGFMSDNTVTAALPVHPILSPNVHTPSSYDAGSPPEESTITLLFPSKGMTETSRPRKRPTALNLTHTNRITSFNLGSPNSLPASPGGLRPGSSSRRRVSTPGLTPHVIQKQRHTSNAQRSPAFMPDYRLNAAISQVSESEMALPTPPLQTDSSIPQFQYGFPHEFPHEFPHAPETPITPSNGSFNDMSAGLFSSSFSLKQPNVPSPLHSSAAENFNFLDSSPQTAPASQTAFLENDVYEAFNDRSAIRRSFSNHDETSGDISFHVPQVPQFQTNGIYFSDNNSNNNNNSHTNNNHSLNDTQSSIRKEDFTFDSVLSDMSASFVSGASQDANPAFL